MVDGTIAQGDSFLSSYVPAVIATPQYQAGNTAIFITWDEDENAGKNNQVPTIVVSPYTHAVKSSTSTTTIRCFARQRICSACRRLAVPPPPRRWKPLSG